MIYTIFENLDAHMANLKEVQRHIINSGERMYSGDIDQQLYTIKVLQELFEDLDEFKRDEDWKELQQPKRKISA